MTRTRLKRLLRWSAAIVAVGLVIGLSGSLWMGSRLVAPVPRAIGPPPDDLPLRGRDHPQRVGVDAGRVVCPGRGPAGNGRAVAPQSRVAALDARPGPAAVCGRILGAVDRFPGPRRESRRAHHHGLARTPRRPGRSRVRPAAEPRPARGRGRRFAGRGGGPVGLAAEYRRAGDRERLSDDRGGRRQPGANVPGSACRRGLGVVADSTRTTAGHFALGPARSTTSPTPAAPR